MAIVKDKKTEQMLMKTVGKRLRSARMAARLSLDEAGEVIGHKGATQLSLAENGQRLLPIVSTYLLANRYAVSLDYLMGRIDDPVADPMETNQGVVVAAINDQMGDAIANLTNLVAQTAVMQIKTQRDDRGDLRNLLERIHQLGDRFARFRDLNPAFDDDMRGSGNLAVVIESLVEVRKGIAARMRHEDQMRQGVVDHHALVALEKTPQLSMQFAR